MSDFLWRMAGPACACVLATTTGVTDSVYAAPLTSAVRAYDEVQPRILRSREVRQIRALKLAQPGARSLGLEPDLPILAGKTALMKLELKVDNRRYRVNLWEYEQSMDDVEIVTSLPGGGFHSEPAPKSGTRFFSGRVLGVAGSTARLYQTRYSGWGGEFSIGDETFVLEPRGWSDPSNRSRGGPRESTSSYIFRTSDADSEVNPAGCAIEAVADNSQQETRAGDSSSRHIVNNLDIKRYKVKYVTAQDYLQARGNDTSVVSAEIFAMHHGVSNMMQQQLNTKGISLQRAGVQILDAPLPPPFADNPPELNGGTLLDSLVSCKGNTSCLGGFLYGSETVSVLVVERGLVKPEGTGSLAGIAKPQSLCGANGAALIDTDSTSTQRFLRLAHELGHVFGAKCHDGPNPGDGCVATGCAEGWIMSPIISSGLTTLYSSCSVSSINTKVTSTPSCRTSVYCGDVNSDSNSPGTCQGVTTRSNTTDALDALKMAVGQVSPHGYSHLADVHPPFGELNVTDANALLQYATCGMPDAVPPDCGQ